MPRATGGPSHSRKRKRILRRASGFVGQPGKNYRSALEFTRKADVYAYRDRRQKKRHFRSLWISRLNAALKQQGISYSRFIEGLKAAKIELDRKVLSDLAIRDEVAFNALVKQAQHALAEKAASAKSAAKKA